MIKADQILELLRTKADGRLFHGEGQELEFKEQFNLAGLAEYFRDFAAFANNRGGYLIFGVTDIPRRPTGLSEAALEQFEKIDTGEDHGLSPRHLFSFDHLGAGCIPRPRSPVRRVLRP